MHFKILFAAFAICAAPCALAENEPARSRKTYFLIDASGSMEKRQVELDAALTAKRNEIEQAGLPNAIETRFGGDNGGICGAPIEIGRTNTGEFQNDDTQIGAALEAALKAAGDDPADIFIFSDEEQTPGCGPDICTVAERFLPRKNIFVQSIPIDSAPIDHVKISCIKSAQQAAQHTGPLLNILNNWNRVEIAAAEPDRVRTFDIDWSVLHFLEK